MASASALRSIARTCAAEGIPFGVVLHRTTPAQSMQDLSEALAALAAMEGFPYKDSITWFADDPLDILINSRVDSHPNALGHAAMARGMVDFLQSNSMLDRVPEVPNAR